MRTPGQSATVPCWLVRRHTIAVAAAGVLLAASMAGWAAGKKGKEVAGKAANETAVADEIPATKADTVHITIQTVPPRKAQVKWGRKNLGPIPAPRALVRPSLRWTVKGLRATIWPNTVPLGAA